MQIINRTINLLFVVTNGIGLGHLTRGLAVAKKLRQINDHVQIIFYTTSLATEVIRREGFPYYYFPSIESMPSNEAKGQWHTYMKQQLEQIIGIYQPKFLVIDGGKPYDGVIATLKEHKEITSIWIKREGDKPYCISYYRKLEQHFTRIIVPKEAGLTYEETEQTAKKIYCNTIISIEKEEAYDRKLVRKSLGVKPYETLIYVQLGAGRNNKIKEDVVTVLNTLLRKRSNSILLGESIIGERLGMNHTRIRTIREYPNAKYFNGIDYAVSAAGYNTFHELLYFGVPTLFIPNKNTTKDDQVARAMRANDDYAGICVDVVTKESVKEAMEYLYTYRPSIARNAQSLLVGNGAGEAAKEISEYIRKMFW